VGADVVLLPLLLPECEPVVEPDFDPVTEAELDPDAEPEADVVADVVAALVFEADIDDPVFDAETVTELVTLCTCRTNNASNSGNIFAHVVVNIDSNMRRVEQRRKGWDGRIVFCKQAIRRQKFNSIESPCRTKAGTLTW